MKEREELLSSLLEFVLSSVGSKIAEERKSSKNSEELLRDVVVISRTKQEIEMSLRHTAAILSENQDALVNGGTMLEEDNSTIHVLFFPLYYQ